LVGAVYPPLDCPAFILIIAIMIAAITVTTSLNPPPLNLTGPPPGYDPPGYDPPDEEWLELWN
jgi:hypothetical protein